jgi:hypothetical protein
MSMIQTYRPVAHDAKATFDQLLQLDSIFNAGLTSRELKLLLAKCGKCGRVMTRRLIHLHTCNERMREVDIIDLTMEDD